MTLNRHVWDLHNKAINKRWSCLHTKILTKMLASNKDLFDKELQVGDTIVVCYNSNGYLTKATITGERSDTTWRIQTFDRHVVQDRTIDKNSGRIVKIC